MYSLFVVEFWKKEFQTSIFQPGTNSLHLQYTKLFRYPGIFDVLVLCMSSIDEDLHFLNVLHIDATRGFQETVAKYF